MFMYAGANPHHSSGIAPARIKTSGAFDDCIGGFQRLAAYGGDCLLIISLGRERMYTA